MRKKLYKIVHIYNENTLSVIYKWFMCITILISIIPLTIKDVNPLFTKIDIFCLVIFIIDYILRWITADYKLNEFSWRAFLRFPFRIISIIDLLCILAIVSSIYSSVCTFALAQVLKVFRVIRFFRYSKNVSIIIEIFKKSKKPLIAVGYLAIGYVFVSAIIMFNVEPDSFNTFFDAVYWATISLTTVGYGDLYPVTQIGRLIAMISSFCGVAIVALPAGVITAEYMSILSERICDKNENDKN